MRILVLLWRRRLSSRLAAAMPQQDVSTRQGKAAATTGPVGAPATLTTRLDFASCLAEDVADDAAQSSRCPSFALLSLDYMGSQCSANGGKLMARLPSQAWSLDVDGDASAEVLVDLVANFDCEGVPGTFACGTGGCLSCSTRAGETWVELGAINADDAPAIEVLPTAEDGKLATLRAAAASASSPAASGRILRVERAANTRAPGSTSRATPSTSSRSSLMTLTKDSAVFDAPGGRKAQPLEEYPLGTAMIVIGTARDAPYTFVSPCNACRRGFVETALLAK